MLKLKPYLKSEILCVHLILAIYSVNDYKCFEISKKQPDDLIKEYNGG
jgi:hypothetical protein